MKSKITGQTLRNARAMPMAGLLALAILLLLSPVLAGCGVPDGTGDEAAPATGAESAAADSEAEDADDAGEAEEEEDDGGSEDADEAGDVDEEDDVEDADAGGDEDADEEAGSSGKKVISSAAGSTGIVDSSQVPMPPVLDPADVVAGIDNPFMPLTPGRVWTYEAKTDQGTERIVVEVLAETRKV